MPRKAKAPLESFLTALISGDRAAVRGVLDGLYDAEVPAERVVDQLVWPALEQLQQMRGDGQLSCLSHHLATRLLRVVCDQLQPRYEQRGRRGLTALVMSGVNDTEELAGQLAADLLEADGYRVQYAGGGVANDEVVEQIGRAGVDRLVVVGWTPDVVAVTRQLVERLHAVGVCPALQVVLGGGTVEQGEASRADGWAADPMALVKVLAQPGPQRAEAA